MKTKIFNFLSEIATVCIFFFFFRKLNIEALFSFTIKFRIYGFWKKDPGVLMFFL